MHYSVSPSDLDRVLRRVVVAGDIVSVQAGTLSAAVTIAKAIVLEIAGAVKIAGSGLITVSCPGVTIRGAGGSIVNQKASPAIISASSASELKISNVTVSLTGAGHSTAAYAITVSNSDDVVLEDVTITGMSTGASGAEIGHVSLTDCDRALLSRISITGGSRAIGVILSSCDDCRVDNCRILSVDIRALFLYLCARAVVVCCTVDTVRKSPSVNEGSGIQLTGCTDSSVVDCTSNEAEGEGCIYISGDTSARVRVTNCRVSRTDTGGAGIHVRTGADHQVDGCSVTAADCFGIWVRYVVGCVIRDNEVFVTATSYDSRGICVRSADTSDANAPSDVLVARNRIRASAASADTYALYIGGHSYGGGSVNVDDVITVGNDARITGTGGSNRFALSSVLGNGGVLHRDNTLSVASGTLVYRTGDSSLGVSNRQPDGTAIADW